jgi:biopolymer transport protein ExbD
MRFPRHTKVFRGQLDAAPYAGVFFLLTLFVLLNSSIVFTPGLPIRLPEATNVPGVTGPTLAIAVDDGSRIYFDNQVTNEERLRQRLKDAVASTPEVTLVIQADDNVKWATLARLMLLARDAGVKTAVPATRPPVAPVPRAAQTP